MRGLSYAELTALPPWTTSEARHGEHMARWTVYRDVMVDPHRLLIVVQLSMRSGKILGLFPIGSVDAEGFIVDPRRRRQPASAGGLYDFT